MRKQTIMPLELRVEKDRSIIFKQLAGGLISSGAFIWLLILQNAWASNPWPIYLVSAFSIAIAGRSVYELLKRPAVLIISPGGIWTKNKGLQPWQNIGHYFIAIKEKDKGPDIPFLLFKLRDTEEEIKISIENCNAKPDEILDLIEQVKGNSGAMKMDTLVVPKNHFL